MAQEIRVVDKSGNEGRVRGSDNRLDTSARTAGRGYYNSRDDAQTYSIVFDAQSAAAGDFVFYFKNTSTTGKIWIIDGVGLNSVENSRMKMHIVSGTAAGGTTLTPLNLNRSSGNAATATAMEGAITGLTSTGLVDFAYVAAAGHEEFRLEDRLRLGQNDAIAIEYDEGTTGDVSGVMFGFFE